MNRATFAVLCLACACEASPSSVGSADLELDPNGTTPLAARLTVDTSAPASLSITVSDGAASFDVTVSARTTEHAVPIVGLRPNTTYEVAVTTVADDGASPLPPMQITTPSLPQPFPVIDAETLVPGAAEPGLSLMDIGGTAEYLAAVDDTGDVVWLYVPPDAGVGDARMLANGNLLYLSGGDIYEMTLLGDIVRRVEVTDRDRDFHHEVFPTAGGTYLTLGLEVTERADFPISDTDPDLLDTVDVTDDTIIEVDASGTVLRRHAVLDILDPTRIGYDSLSTHFELGTPNDWCHANAIIADGDSVIVSCRHQDAVFKARLDTGELVWILAPHDNWSDAFRPFLLEPVGDVEWSYHQHAPALTGDGTLVLFDNGNHRADPFDGTAPMTPATSYSRAVEYRIDESAMTVEQVWEYGAGIEPRLYAFFIGDADPLPATGNVWINFGGLTGVGDQSSADMGRGRFQSRLVEVERPGGDAVFALSVYSDADDYPDGFRVYRSERIAGLYPASGM